MKSPVTLGTSIAPFNLEIQRTAVTSWIANGFSVVSVNSEPEFERLSPDFPYVEFRVALRTATSKTGKPYVYLDDVLQALSSCTSSAVGIVNSDIRFLPCDLQATVARRGNNSVIVANRSEVAAGPETVFKENLFGIDVVFFDRDVIQDFPTSEFCLGMPWRDTWMLWLPLLKGFPLKRIVTPIAIHVDHISRWDKFYEIYGEELFRRTVKVALEGSQATQTPILPPSSTSYSIFALLIISYALAQCERIHIDNAPLLDSWDYPQPDRTCKDFVYMATQLTSILQMQHQSHEALRRELRNYEESLSWRITAPVRELKGFLLKKFRRYDRTKSEA